MSRIKHWLEENIDNLTDEQMIEMGWPEEEIRFLRECFSEKDES